MTDKTKPTSLTLWRSAETTDPAYVKPFNRPGGFRGSAINATYLARRATEVFGPMGIGWGLDILDEQVREGAPIILDGVAVGHELIHVVRARLWYEWGEKRGEVVQFGQTAFVGRNKNGFYTDEEAPKKSLTDAMSKCLSLLGFGADVHLGLFDDNKYVNDLRNQFADKPEAPEPPQAQRQSDLAQVATHTAAIEGAVNLATLRTAYEAAVGYARECGNALLEASFVKAKDKRKAALSPVMR